MYVSLLVKFLGDKAVLYLIFLGLLAYPKLQEKKRAAAADEQPQ